MSITEAEVIRYFGLTYKKRGDDYQRNRKVLSAQLRWRRVVGQVAGGAALPYSVEVALSPTLDVIESAVCSCPMGGVCKHGAALLLHAIRTGQVGNNVQASALPDIRGTVALMQSKQGPESMVSKVPVSLYFRIERFEPEMPVAEVWIEPFHGPHLNSEGYTNFQPERQYDFRGTLSGSEDNDDFDLCIPSAATIKQMIARIITVYGQVDDIGVQLAVNDVQWIWWRSTYKTKILSPEPEAEYHDEFLLEARFV